MSFFVEYEAKAYIDAVYALCGDGPEAVKKFKKMQTNDKALVWSVFVYMESIVDKAPVLAENPRVAFKTCQEMWVISEEDDTTHYGFQIDSGGWCLDKAEREVYTFGDGVAMSLRKGAYLVQLSLHVNVPGISERLESLKM